MLTSPVTITIDGVAHSLSKINQDNFGSVFLKKADKLEIRLAIRHSYEKASAAGQYERHNMDLTYTVWDVDGKPSTTQSYQVLRSLRGNATKLSEDLTKALNVFSTANVSAVASWES